MGADSLHGPPHQTPLSFYKMMEFPDTHSIFPSGSGRHPHRPGNIFWRNRPSSCWRHTGKTGEPGVPVWSPEGATGYQEEETHWPLQPAANLHRHRRWRGLDSRDWTFSSFHLPWLVKPGQAESLVVPQVLQIFWKIRESVMKGSKVCAQLFALWLMFLIFHEKFFF